MRELACLLALAAASNTVAAERVLQPGQRHLRSGEEREWSEFPEKADGKELALDFAASRNTAGQTLRLRHRDVKLGSWTVSVNGHVLGRLPADERDMVLFLPVGPSVLADGQNELKIASDGRSSDDILVGDIRLIARPVGEVLKEATVEVTVTDRDTKAGLPCRLTIADAAGSLAPVGAESDDRLAVRTGAIYTTDGKARFGLPAGDYVIYAGRGFEYSIDSFRVSLRAGDRVEKRLSIRREVPVPGYVSCDTHIHTLDHSRHGDATVLERLITIAGEGLELAISTEHNTHADYAPEARKAGLNRYFTTAVGNEVTTHVGHFNIFPLARDAPVPDHTTRDWDRLFADVYGIPGVQVVVLNHPRDNHLGYRPFGAERHVASAGQNLEGWRLRANAMEVINSGALQSDPLRLYYDWFGLLNRGLAITGVGSSDSHTVDYKPVAQARTYVAAADSDPGRIDVAAAARALRQGRVMVSFGLLAEITVQDEFGPGDTVSLEPKDAAVKVRVRILGPSWSAADHVALYANGVRVREARILPNERASKAGGEKWSRTWNLPRPLHDTFLVAIASGPGVMQPFWSVRKPYQPASKDWIPRVMGSTGAVWLDADGDGRITSAYDYAAQLVKDQGQDLPGLFRKLASYDEAVAAQTASLLQAGGRSPLEEPVRTALSQASAATRRGFEAYLKDWKASQAAR